jgi:hypothetical protein
MECSGKIGAVDPNEYYKLNALRDGKIIPIVIWNGIKDYKNKPRIDVLAYEFKRHHRDFDSGRLGLIQISRPPLERHGLTALEFVSEHAETKDAIVVWTRDTRTYRAIADEFENTRPSARFIRMEHVS